MLQDVKLFQIFTQSIDAINAYLRISSGNFLILHNATQKDKLRDSQSEKEKVRIKRYTRIGLLLVRKGQVKRVLVAFWRSSTRQVLARDDWGCIGGNCPKEFCPDLEEFCPAALI